MLYIFAVDSIMSIRDPKNKTNDEVIEEEVKKAIPLTIT